MERNRDGVYKTGVAAVGDVLDINCWSNIPYYFFKEGKKQGLFDEPWQLDLSSFDIDRNVWNAFRLLMGRGIGGYQYSKSFLTKAESQIPQNFFRSKVISFNQTFPSAKKIIDFGGKIYYYIDISLHDLFNEPSYGVAVPRAMKTKALELEKRNYDLAEKVVTMGHWAQKSLIEHYKLPQEKIMTILPGANLPEVDISNDKFNPGAGETRDLVLGFVGKDWERKGLLVLLQVARELRARGVRINIRVLGNCPNELQKESLIDFTGFVDKQSDSDKFCHNLRSCDIGCLFSESEALGISTLEFLHLGVPVAGFFHQGLEDTLMDGASFRFSLRDPIGKIANAFERYVQSDLLQRQMKEEAKKYSNHVTWRRCVNEWRSIIKR